MKKFILLIISLIFISLSADEAAKIEFITTIKSNLDFYNKIEPGMGFKGEAISKLVDENGEYQNCTIVLRGKQIVLNSTLEVGKIYFYETHWVDINVEGSTGCEPSNYPTGSRSFVSSEKKRTAQTVLILIARPDVNVEKINNKIYRVKYIVAASDENDEIKVDVTYNLNFPLFMSPDSRGFTHQFFNHKEIDLSSIALCPPVYETGECMENQNLRYLLN